MYYESRTHEIIEKEDIPAVIKYIEDGCPSFHAVGCKVNGDLILAVPDGHIDNPLLELAIVNDTKQIQIESLTWGWLKPHERQKYFTECFNSTLKMGKAIVPRKSYQIVNQYFTCGCCGEGFKSDGDKQKKFDQDAGYGICPNCEKYYT